MRKRTKVVLMCGVMVMAAVVTAPRAIPVVLAWHRPDIQFVVSTEEKRIFITIDDAPSKSTAEILQVLRKHDVPATFFVMADRVKSPAQLEEIVAAGCSLGNHLRSTKACSNLSLEDFRGDFDACSTLLERARGARLFRPASDFGTKEQVAYARSRGYRAVMGTVFPMDHWISDSRLLVLIERWLTVRGGIVVLHDGNVRGQTTAAVLDRLLPQLREAGYSFGRLEEPNKAPNPTPLRVPPGASRLRKTSAGQAGTVAPLRVAGHL